MGEETSKADEVAKKFLMLAILNGFLVLLFTIPILIPSLCIATPPGQFGCIDSMETSWPGTWLLVAYLVFTTVGVFGSLGWALAYRLKASLMAKTEAKRSLVLLQLVLFEVGVLGATALMAAIGYVGGGIIAHGGSAAVAAEAVAQNIIPPLSSDPTSILNDVPPVLEAAFIGLSVLAQLIGLISLVTLKKEPGAA